MHRSTFDLRHHHIIVLPFIIAYSAESFFFTTLFTFGLASALTEADFFTLETRFRRALIFFLERVLPNDPMVLFPFADFLSPLPILKFY
jgi:hypothetical protein